MSANRMKLNMDKTELLWVGSKYNLSKLNGSGPSSQLKSSTVNSRQHVRVLGVQFSSDLSLDKHISCVSSSCFHQLRQLRRIRRSLDKEFAATLVHAYVTSRVDYCNALFAAAPKTATDKLQHVLNAAARLISDTWKYDQGLARLIHQDLHWLDIPERVSYKHCLLTHRCLLGKAPVYLSDYCTPVFQVAARQHLRSAARHRLVVPLHRLSTYGRRAFAVAGPMTFKTRWAARPQRQHNNLQTTFKRHIFSSYLHV